MEKFKRAVEEFDKKWTKCGYMEFISWDEYAQRELMLNQSYQEFLESRLIQFYPAPGVMVLNYDLCTDDLDDQQVEVFQDDFYAVFDLAIQELKKPLHDTDGSGNGLYYGLALFAA